jgi:hypothetical protein
LYIETVKDLREFLVCDQTYSGMDWKASDKIVKRVGKVVEMMESIMMKLYTSVWNVV